MPNNLAYQEENREELINGQAVAMSPSPSWNHVAIAGNIYRIFANHTAGKACTAIPDGFDLQLSEENVFVPDMMVVCDRSKIKRHFVSGAPDLVVEVLSPRTAKNDKWHKKNAYEASGVPEYWIVDPAGRSIEVYLLRDGGYVLDNLYTHYAAEELADLTEGERAAATAAFRCHLYDDLPIRLEDVFANLL